MKYLITLALISGISACGGSGSEASDNTNDQEQTSGNSENDSSDSAGDDTNEPDNNAESNAAPVANAGDNQATVVGSLVNIDGSGSSDSDSDALTYSWSFISKPEGSLAFLSNYNAVSPAFTADVVGGYVLGLVVNDGKEDSGIDDVIVTVATAAEGIISSDTTWSVMKSPYLLVDNVQIANGATLHIEAGVTIIGRNMDIRVFGTLDINGTENSRVKLDDVNILPGTSQSNELHYIEIDYVEAISGSIYPITGYEQYGNIVLRNSILEDQDFMYLWYPVEDCIIEKNVFINSGGVSVGHKNGVKVYIRNNVFYRYEGDTNYHNQIFAVKNWASYDTSETIVEYNSFLSTDRVAAMLPSGYSDAKMTAINNYWNTTDTDVIEAMIYDKGDDLGSGDYIVYMPFLTSPDAGTPVSALIP